MKQIPLILISLAILGWQGCTQIKSSYQQSNKYFTAWSLADKSSTLQAKRIYVAQFVKSLHEGNQRGEFASHDAIWLQTPDNSFEANLAAVETLSQRLDEISGMDPKTFEYNTALQQITAQEQGEATHMLDVLHGCFELANYPIVWCWIGATICCGALLIGAVGVVWWLLELS